MRVTVKTATAVLTLIAGLMCTTGLAGSALASTGGAPASGGSSPKAAGAHIHPSAIATWFGPGFYGKQTACGQTLTPLVMGVANRTLPCGTLVSVTYGGHNLTVPVLDRGPYSHGADWDLTAAAAEALGITETVRIKTRVVGSTPNTPTLGLPAGASTALSTGGALAG